jgi:chaperonin cofactor prefoldin
MSYKTAIDELGVEEESELGQALLKLDKVYEAQETIKKRMAFHKKEYRKLKVELEQKIEDADLMETFLMHKSNHDTRKYSSVDDIINSKQPGAKNGY